jgi:hypothetical protein
MRKLKDNQKGFSAIEFIMVFVIIVLIGAVGYFVYKNHHEPVKVVTVTKTVAAPAKTTNSANYLVIKEWGVKIILTSPISNATYQLVTNNQYLKPSAFLSTSTLDASADCTSYYTQGATANDPKPTFQFIERFSLSDTTSLSEGGPMITALQAAQQSPSTYIRVGSYVYTFGHGSGEPCSEQASTIEPAFQSSFATIQAD